MIAAQYRLLVSVTVGLASFVFPATELSAQPLDEAVDSTTVFELIRVDGMRYGFRIPAVVVTKSGMLLAFCERRIGLHDHAENDIVLRRSSDGGRSWSASQVIADEGNDSLNDPCVVVLDTGRVLLRYTRFPKGVHARNSDHTIMADPGYGGPTNVRLYLAFSDDDGETWSIPQDVTRVMRREEAISVGSPGVGVQLTQGPHRGRVLFPNYEVYRLAANDRTKANSVSYSDDGGETWELSSIIDGSSLDGFGDEAQLAELPDGGLLISARYGPDHSGRLLSISRDGGEAWSSHQLAGDLITPACMSSILRYSWPEKGKPGILLHSLPYARDARSNGAIMTSRDDGRSWQLAKIIVPGDFSYSCLTRLPGGDVGCLFETDDHQRIVFLRLTRELIDAP